MEAPKLRGLISIVRGWYTEFRSSRVATVSIIREGQSLSFVAAAPLATRAQQLHARLASMLSRFEVAERLPEDAPLHTGDAEILVFGMGRIGTTAYDELRSRYGRLVLGVDLDARVVDRHLAAGRIVVRGDAADADFWDRLCPESVRLVLLALHSHAGNLIAARRILETRMPVRLSAITRHKDEAQELAALGVNETFNVYAEAGTAFAQHTCEKLWNDDQKEGG